MSLSLLRLLPVASLLLGLSGWPAARPVSLPIVEPRQTTTTTPARLAEAPAQPAVVTKNYLPLVTNRYASHYTSPFGMVMYTTINNDAGQAKMRAAGTHWFTTDLLWADVEPNPPVGNVHTYTWTSNDQDALNVQAAGGEMYMLINRNPTWASAYPSGPVTNTANLVAFAAALAERYDGDYDTGCGGTCDAPGHTVINYWSFYAEPDNGAEWAALQGKGYWGHNAAGYAAMLMQVSDAMHAANPNAKILIGGVAFDSFESDGGPFVESFLGDTLAALGNASAVNYIDAIAFHYYPINTTRFPSILEKGLEIRAIMNAHDLSQLELIVPEMGYWSTPANGSSELKQAQTLAQMYVKGLSIGISHLDWFATFDDGGGMEAHGLFNNHNLDQPKQAYTAYSTLAHSLNGLHYNRTVSISNGEGYVFRTTDGRELTAAWATGASALAYFPTSCIHKTDLLGGVSVIADGGPGDADGANGWVAVPLSQNHAVYLADCD